MFIRKCLLLSLAVVLANVAAVCAQGRAHFARHDTIQPFILSDIEVVRYNIFDTTGGRSSMLGNTLNALHVVTKENIVRYEIFVEPGDTVTQGKLDQIESNMRRLDVFADIDFQVIADTSDDSGDSGGLPYATLRVITQDNWSTRASAIFSTGGNSTVYGATISEQNLFGRAKQIAIGADYSTINDRGWGFSGQVFDPNINGTHLQISGALALSRLSVSTVLSGGMPFYSDLVRSAFNAAVGVFDGQEFLYFRGVPRNLVFASETYNLRLSGWYGQSTHSAKGDLFRGSARVLYDHTSRDSLSRPLRAFENTTGLFGGLFSLNRRYARISSVEFNGEALVAIGGMGSVSLGYMGPNSTGADEVAYIGAEARQSAWFSRLYLYGAMQAGTGLAGKETRYTLERFVGSGALLLGPGVLAARLEQTNVWNWPRYIFQPLDNLHGLRGYPLFGLFGDSRLVLNTDYRLYPLVTLLGYQLGVVGFYDIGGVWIQGEKLPQTRFHSSTGFGIRVGSTGGTFNQGLFRIDVAYNLDERKFSQIIFSTSEAFDVFGTLDYQPPGPYLP